MVLQEYFNKDRETATQIMLKIHHDGRGVCGVYLEGRRRRPRSSRCCAAARARRHPLQCIMEAA